MYEQRFMPGDIPSDLDSEDFLWRIKDIYKDNERFDDYDRYRTFINFPDGKIKIYKTKLRNGPPVGECVIFSTDKNAIRRIQSMLEGLTRIHLHSCGPVYST